MRSALALLLVLPAASGALIDDPAADVGILVAGESAGALPAGVQDSLDIRSVDIAETPASFQFSIGFEARHSPGDEAVRDWLAELRFHHGGEGYRMVHHAIVPGTSLTVLQRFDSTNGYYRSIENLVASWEGSTLHVEVPRHAIPDEKGTPPSPAGNLSAIEARSTAPYRAGSLAGALPAAITGQEYAATLQDRAGDDAPATYPIQQGLEQSGTGRLGSNEPFRISNGEASTFVYWANATRGNPGTGAYTLHATQVPSGWGVEVPAGRIDLTQGVAWGFPVIVHTAFAHSHGSTESFILELRDAEGPGAARLAMGIMYPGIPQPSGHHNTVYLRSRASDNLADKAMAPAREPAFGNGGHEIAYMNAAPEDDNDIATAVDFRRCGPLDTQVHRCLRVPLSPALGMGLDFRSGENGTLEVEIDTPIPLLHAQADGVLVHYRYEERSLGPGTTGTFRVPTVLAHLPATDPFDLDAGAARALAFVVEPTPAADLVAYGARAALELHLNLSYLSAPDNPLVYGIGEVNPRLLPGGVMQLPLDEYKDPLASLPSLGSGLQWSVNTTERYANPGDIILYRATLQNQGPTDTFAIRLIGQNRAWADDPAGDVRIKTNGTHTVSVVVRVPAGAPAQTTADLVLEAASTSDATRRGLLQLRTIVTDDPVPDDGALIDDPSSGTKKSPGLGVLGILAIAMFARRRRR